MTASKPQLLATAGTLNAMRECVSRFYGGQSKTLIPTGDDSWKVVDTHSSKPADGVRVIRKRGRFRFEMAMP